MNANDSEEAKILGVELYAYTGEDELGSGVIGLKQGLVPAGMVPLVVIDRHKDRLDTQYLIDVLRRQSKQFGKRIYLVRFSAIEIVKVIDGHE
jgi:hypothetical protein